MRVCPTTQHGAQGFPNRQPVKKSSSGIQRVCKQKDMEAVEIPLPVSMHTGQIITLTKMLTASDLRFYGFEAGAPVERWRSGPSGSF
ncbi:MAG TPA: hypothetical protein VJM08_02050 [Anaerolineales bacterium]|nr:hypothetical protein [Anaerolineales bacterium]